MLAGRYLLNPFFRVLAWTGAREVMTAAALLVVLGAALIMEHAGMSMALGAFLAGLLLAESNFRHQLEADIEPFRGLLLGLFFMSVGMGMDARLILSNALLLALARRRRDRAQGRRSPMRWSAGWGRARATPCAARRCSRRRANSPSSWCRSAGALAILSPAQAGLASAVAALTMVLGPVVAKGSRSAGAPGRRPAEPEFDLDSFDGAHGARW